VLFREEYRFDETVSNVMTGISYLCFEAYFRIFAILAYSWSLAHFGITELQASTSVFLGTLLTYDCIIYWNHRLAHRSSLFWAAHIGHHQSERLNTGAAVRVTIGNRVLYFAPVLLLAVIGVPLKTFIIVNTLVGLYPILTHTPLTKRLKFLEWVLVTPSHHRVHHGRNAQYIDRNFASVFSFWDFIFRSYEPELETVEYGITHSMPHYSVYGSQFLQFAVIYSAVKEAKGVRAKLIQLFGPPEKLKISQSALQLLFKNKRSPDLVFTSHSRVKIVMVALSSLVFTIFWMSPNHAPNFTWSHASGDLSIILAFACTWAASTWIQENAA
jgi:alkylglycerol monooxygenase